MTVFKTLYNKTHSTTTSLLNEFKQFAMRGNVLDLAVGVIIGAAFSKIVTSLVEDLLMPTLGLFLGAINLSGLSLIVGDTTIKYGNFLQNTIDFMVVAFAIFLLIKGINILVRKEEVKEKKRATAQDQQVVLLQQIKTLLEKDRL